jgi:hypothetical protein
MPDLTIPTNTVTVLESTNDWKTVQFTDAIDYLTNKLDIPVEVRSQVATAMQETAFYVTGMIRAEALAEVHSSLNNIITNGGTISDFKKEFKAIAERTGFTPREGISRRAETVFETNVHSALNAGIMQRMRETVTTRPYASLLTGGGARTCGNCSMMGGVTMSIQQWDSRGGPPFHHRCRCELRSFSVTQVERYSMKIYNPDTDSVTRPERNGATRQIPLNATYQYVNPKTGKIESIPEGISPGFNYPKGTGNARVNEAVVSKVSELPAPLQAMVSNDFQTR